MGHLSKHVKNVHQKSEQTECSECDNSNQKSWLKNLLTQKKKSVKHKNFFSHNLTETYFGEGNLFFHL